MRTFLVTVLFTSIFILSGSKLIYAQTYKDQFTLTDDNDQYINPNHDRYYTDGIILTLTHALKRPQSDTGLVKKIIEYQFGQQIYNPSTGHVWKPSLFDRPFTGYLFIGTSLNWLYANEGALKINAQLGTIGPDALGEQVQVGFHKLFKLYPVGPWKVYQLNNEVGLNLDLDYKKLLYRIPENWFDISADPEVRLGNTFTNANAAVLLRFGELGKLFESASTNSRVSSSANGTQKHEFYFFAEPQFSYVAYNATIEGGLFSNDKGPTFGIYHYVFTQQLGLQFSSARWSASYTAFIRTREVKSTALGDQWASLNLAYRFGKI